MPTLSNDGYIPDESGVLGKKLIFVLQSIDSYFGSNVFKVEIKYTLKDFCKFFEMVCWLFGFN